MSDLVIKMRSGNVHQFPGYSADGLAQTINTIYEGLGATQGAQQRYVKLDDGVLPVILAVNEIESIGGAL